MIYPVAFVDVPTRFDELILYVSCLLCMADTALSCLLFFCCMVAMIDRRKNTLGRVN